MAVVSESWATLWEAMADALGERTAVVVGDHRMAWAVLDDRAARLASALAAFGVGSGDRVAQLLFNAPEYLETVYAALKCRATPVNVNYRYQSEEIAHVLGDSGAKVLVVHRSLAARLDPVRWRLAALRAVVVVDDGAVDTPAADAPGPDAPGAAARGPDRAHRYEELIAAHGPAARLTRSGDDTLVLYTGGTTGLPKGVVWPHRSLFGSLAVSAYGAFGYPVPETAAEVGRIAAELAAAGRSPVNLCAPPLMHGTALFLAMGTFVLGGTVVLLSGRRFDPDELLGLVGRERVTQISLVGDAFALPLAAALDRAEAEGHPYDMSSLSRLVSSGAIFSAPAKRAFTGRGPIEVLDLLGASEGGPYAISVSPAGREPLDTAVFCAAPSTVLFDDATWRPMAWGTGRPGVLAVSGPMPSAYWNDPERSARTFRRIDGVDYTMPGDYALVDADGTVHLLGRGSICINTGGEKVYPEEVEVVIRTLEGVSDALVVGVPDDRLGEVVAAVVAVAPGAVLDEAAVAAAVRARLAAYKAPRQVVFVDEVRRSPSGKADYRWARAAVATGPADHARSGALDGATRVGDNLPNS